MPAAKRKAPAKQSSTAAASTAPPKPRLTKLAKQNDISNEQERQVADAFALFAVRGVDGYDKESKSHGVIESASAVRVLTALGISTSKAEAAEVRDTLDPDDEGYITYEPLLAYAAIRLNQLAADADDETRAHEVQTTFDLFTRGAGGGSDGGLEPVITVAHLKRVARTIREEVDDATLKEMIMEANGTGKDGWKQGVSLEQFEAILKRAGVYGP